MIILNLFLETIYIKLIEILVLSCRLHCVNKSQKYISASIFLNHSFKMLKSVIYWPFQNVFFLNFTTSYEFKNILKVFNSNVASNGSEKRTLTNTTGTMSMICLHQMALFSQTIKVKNSNSMASETYDYTWLHCSHLLSKLSAFLYSVDVFPKIFVSLVVAS